MGDERARREREEEKVDHNVCVNECVIHFLIFIKGLYYKNIWTITSEAFTMMVLLALTLTLVHA